MELIVCPEPGCQAPAEIIDRWVLESTDGPVEHVRLRCLARHILTPRAETLAALRQEMPQHRPTSVAVDDVPGGPART